MNELLRLLDNGFGVAIYRNASGNYTGIATTEDLSQLTELDVVQVDDESLDALTKKLTAKVTQGGDSQ